MISVTIPVGPFKGNKDWLKECLTSVVHQTMLPAHLVLIDDGARLKERSLYYQSGAELINHVTGKSLCPITLYKAPWRLGISHAFNFGVMLAPTECVFMLGSDDTLEPECLERCWQSYLDHDKADAYYYVPIRYMDTGELQGSPCNAAMVTKSFFRRTGGFPIETAIGGGDTTLLSICLAHKLPGHNVAVDKHLYNYRRHPDIHTFKLQKWWPVINEIRSKLTEDWSEQEIAEWSSNYG